MAALFKLITIIICAFLHFGSHTVSIKSVTLLLVALIISSLPLIIRSQLLGKQGIGILVSNLWLIYLIIALFVPELRFYIPLIILDIVNFRLYIPGILGIICLFVHFSDGPFILLLSVISVFAQILIMKNETLTEDLKKLRDTSKEHELLIEEKNRRLIDKQDAEIYAATLKERNRIAREIHDNVGHMLTRSILQVGAIKTINKNEVLNEPLEGLHETLNTAMTNIRSSVHDLHDESVDLYSAIHEITDPVETIDIIVDYDMGNHIPRNIKYCFISITKEAVNNTLKHSNATHMNITLQEHPAFYQLLIHDNGTNVILNPSDGIGLANMKDRVKSLNGNIKITTENGFKILISIIKDK